MPFDKPLRTLTPKAQRFVEVYLTCWIGTYAARDAGYKWPDKRAWQLLRDPLIQDAIAKRMAEVAMEANEALARLAEQARMNVADFFANGDPAQGLNTEYLRTHGHLVKKVKTVTNKLGEVVVELELHDAQAALVHIGKHLKLFTEQVDFTEKVIVINRANVQDERNQD